MRPPNIKSQVATATAAQDGLDRLVGTGAAAGGLALRGDLRAVLLAVQGAQTPQALREALVEVLRDMDAKRFAQQLARARTMAHMTGMATVLDETDGGR